jgi:hypothetical protein
MPEKMLTTAVVSYGDSNGLGIPRESFEPFDFVNVMTYDGPDHETMEQFETELAYCRRGLPPEKLVCNGIPAIQAKTCIAVIKANSLMFWAPHDDPQGELSLVNGIYRTANP